MLSRLKSRLRRQDEQGQMIILLVFAMTVVFAVGVIVVDVGMWLSERRGAQVDADFVALTGAWELLDPGASEGDVNDAINAALVANDDLGNASVEGVPDIDLAARCVGVDIRHDSARLFSQFFGLEDDLDIGAHAKACAGAVNAPGNVVPFQIDNNPGPCFDVNSEPIFTSMCPLELGAQSGDPRGMLDLEAPGDYCSGAPGSGNIDVIIEDGASGICTINETGTCDPIDNGPWYDCVAVQDGNPKKVLDGVAARLAAEGACDDNSDGIEAWEETVMLIIDTGDPFTSIYEARDCDPLTDGKQYSVRLISLIVLEDKPPSGNTGWPILAFGSFRLEGCAAEGVPVDDETDLDRDCSGDYGPHGHAVVYGRFVKIVFTGGGISPSNDQTTAFGIGLVE